MVGFRPMFLLLEIGSLQITMHTLRSTLVRACVACVAFASTAVGAHAQTYYYYPPTTTPTYYTPAGYGGQTTWYIYPGQYSQPVYSYPTYQTSYTPQYYQTSYTQPTVQTTETAQSTQPAAESSASQTTIASQEATQPAATAPVGDPYGFLGWLNATRASYGLPAVGYDPNLASWAAVNNSHQASRGIGHFVMGPARRQNSAMGGFPGVESMWMASPAHRAALLDPTIQWIGIAGLGAYWTFNAY
jgi:uncharacterized protein YkwD